MAATEWYERHIRIAQKMLEAATQRMHEDEYLYWGMRGDVARASWKSRVAEDKQEVGRMQYFVEFLKDMWRKDEEIAWASAMMENYPVPDDYDPHPCAEQIQIDSTNYPVYSYCCGEWHFEVAE